MCILGTGTNTNQVQQATYKLPQASHHIICMELLVLGIAGATTVSAFPLYRAGTNTNNNAYSGNSASSQATTVHDDYFKQNRAYKYYNFSFLSLINLLIEHWYTIPE